MAAHQAWAACRTCPANAEQWPILRVRTLHVQQKTVVRGNRSKPSGERQHLMKLSTRSVTANIVEQLIQRVMTPSCNLDPMFVGNFSPAIGRRDSLI